MNTQLRRTLAAAARLLSNDRSPGDATGDWIAGEIRKALRDDDEPDYHPGRIANVDHETRAEHLQNILHVYVPEEIVVVCWDIEWRMKGSD